MAMTSLVRQLLFPVPVTLQSTLSRNAQQLGAKVVTCSDSTGWVYDPEGIDCRCFKRNQRSKTCTFNRVQELPSKQLNIMKDAAYGLLNVMLLFHVLLRMSCFLEDAKQLVANGCMAVCEGANMPTTIRCYISILQENGVMFAPGKASNAGGVATSALEMSQNSERLSWTFEEVDSKT